MKALTLIRPWDGAIVHGPKRIENRTWSPPASLLRPGERFAIHAGQKFDVDAASFIAAHARLPHGAGQKPGVVVGVATFDHAHDTDDCGRDDCATCNDPWAFGPWCWVLRSVVALGEPVPCRGAQGIWALPREVEQLVLEQVGGPR